MSSENYNVAGNSMNTNGNRKTSAAGKSLIKKWEGLGTAYKSKGVIEAYKCPAGVPTIGWGHTRTVDHSDIGNRSISLEQAESLLEGDLDRFEKYVHNLNPDLNQNQFDALVAAAFNLGSFGAGLTRNIQTGAFNLVPKKLRQYIHPVAGGKPCGGKCGNKKCRANYLQGLINRRAEEAKLFAKKDGTKSNAK